MVPVRVWLAPAVSFSWPPVPSITPAKLLLALFPDRVRMCEPMVTCEVALVPRSALIVSSTSSISWPVPFSCTK